MTHREYINQLVNKVLKISNAVYKNNNNAMYKHIKHMTSCILNERDNLYRSHYGDTSKDRDLNNLHFQLYHQKQLWLLRRYRDLIKLV